MVEDFCEIGAHERMCLRKDLLARGVLVGVIERMNGQIAPPVNCFVHLREDEPVFWWTLSVLLGQFWGA